MAIELTKPDLQDLEAQAQQQGEQIYQTTEFGVQYNLPKQLGEGGDRTLKLHDGLTLYIRKGKLRQSIREVRQHESRFPLVAKFYLSGSSRVQTLDTTDIDRDYEETRGCHYLYHLPNHTEVERWPADEPIHVVMVLADPDYFSKFVAGKTGLSTSLQKLLEGDRTQRFHQPLGQMTPLIRQLLQQVLHCPYTGLMQQLYLEGKALELLASQFALWTDERLPTASLSLCAQDIEQLHQAKDILLQRAKHPPSLSELARLVGLNDRKLKQGFRQLFGTTVFGYLRDYRMQQAQHLLHQSHMSVAQVAAKVGYRNSEAFSTAFRRQFAVSPKAYQLGQRG
jgi:AraC-like DNA-binding protein